MENPASHNQNQSEQLSERAIEISRKVEVM